MKRNKKNIIKSRGIRVLGFCSLLGVFIYLLLLCCKIPYVEKEVPPTTEGPITVELEARNPNSLRNMLTLHDLSKTEYELNFPYYKETVHPFSIIEKYDSLTPEASRIAVSFSEIEGGQSTSFKEMIMVMPQSNKIRFYTKNVMSDNIQMIRNFFLTEIILFLLALFGREVYKLVTDIFNERRFLHQRVFGISTSKRTMMFYLALSMITVSFIILINRVPHNQVFTENVAQTSLNSFFSPYDISCAYHHLTIPSSNRSSDTIAWSSNEIVEFVPQTFKYFTSIVGPKSVMFKNVPMDRDFNITFYTRYLQSSNYQEVRLFILTTLLLFFLERSFFYFRKWTRNKDVS